MSRRLRSYLATFILALAIALPAVASADTAWERSKQVAAAKRKKRIKKAAPKLGNKARRDEVRMFAQLKKLWSGKILRQGTTAIYIVDAKTGREILKVHENAPLNPASNVKLIATAASLDLLGADWHYETHVFGPTPSVKGVAQGNIYLRGSYDPTFRAEHLMQLAAQLAKSGIVKIDGDIIIGREDARDALRKAKIQIRVRGTTRGQPPEVTISPPSAMVNVKIAAKTSATKKKRALKIRAVAYTDENGKARVRIDVTGVIRPRAVQTYWRVVKDRGLFTAHALRSALEQSGIIVTGEVRRASFDDYVRESRYSFLPVNLATHQSLSLDRLVTMTNKRSINWLADSLIKKAGSVAYGGPPSMDKGVRLMSYWLEKHADIDPKSVVLDSGSGLSYQTELSAKQIVRVLREACGFRGATETDDEGDVRLQQVFRSSLSVAGVDGTLRRRFQKTLVRGKLIGKTGTLTRIVALSGILKLGKRSVAFAIITNDHHPDYRWNVRQTHKRIVQTMYKFMRQRLARR